MCVREFLADGEIKINISRISQFSEMMKNVACLKILIVGGRFIFNFYDKFFWEKWLYSSSILLSEYLFLGHLLSFLWKI